jgi:hypothetical protein
MSVDPHGFIDSVTWRFARTMPDALIRTGETQHYRGWAHRSVTVDDFDYWLTWAGDAGHIINRKPSAEAGWDEV